MIIWAALRSPTIPSIPVIEILYLSCAHGTTGASSNTITGHHAVTTDAFVHTEWARSAASARSDRSDGRRSGDRRLPALVSIQNGENDFGLRAGEWETPVVETVAAGGAEA